MKLSVWLMLLGIGISPAAYPVAAGTDKTLVSWVCLANTTQQGGSALTIQCGDQFDGIVFGEKVPGKWMAGSDFFRRTQGDQLANTVEKADDKTLIQMAIVYKGNQISIYRNGEPYASYEANSIDLLSARDNMAVFGLRHEGAATGQNLQGSIEDARIYDRALTADEIKKLQPNQPSEIKPYAWWTFEKGKETDLMGRFPVNNLIGGAMIEGGRLVLETSAAELIAAANKTVGDTLVMFETPAMPANPPADWLTFHLLHPGPGGAMPGDPNPTFYWKGRYHLHYIYNHKAGFAFAHVSGTDLVHWTWHPTTLTPRTMGHGMFSGTGFITKEGKPAIIYHGQGSGRNQLAFALDDNLEQWTKPVPVIPEPIDGKIPDISNWDPDCWLNGDTYYALSGGGNPSLMKSSDLKVWKFLGPLLHDDYPANIGVPKGEDISCANMFKIGKKWMLLCISHGLGCRYYLGDFKDEKYLPEFHALMSWNGNNFFAPESVLTKDGRRVMWAWLLNLPVAPCGVQSLPRELALPEDGVLRIRPLRELEVLRCDRKQEEGITVKSDTVRMLKEISGNALELEVTFTSPTAKELGLDVLCDKNGENGMRVAYMPEGKILRVGTVHAPFELKKGEDLTLRIFIDKNLVEVFANDRQAAVSADRFVPENLDVSLFSKGGDSVVKQVKCWKMKSIYQNKMVEEPKPHDDDWFLLTSHKEQTDGLHLAVSPDGLKWQVVNDDKSVLKPTIAEVFRDPSIAKDESGTYHLIWTIAWGCGQHKGIGYASSKDLINWSEQRIIPVMENEPKTEFIWAPELFWDSGKKEWMIHWSSSVTDKYPETLELFDGHSNPRIYCTTTKDFKTLTPSKLLFNPDCLAIDSYVYRGDDKNYYVFFKADRKEEPKRGILMAKASALTGPYIVDPRMITAPEEGWAEGPCAIKVGEKNRLYYAQPGDYGAYESTDMKSWTNIRKEMVPPGGYRHGTVIRISAEEAKRLLNHEYKN